MNKRKKMKLLIAVGLALVISLVALACAPAPETGTITFKMATSGSPEHPVSLSCQRMADAVFAASDGRLVVEVHHSGALGDWQSVVQEVMRGTIEMDASVAPSIFDPRLEMVYLPFLVTSWDEALKAKGSGGPLFNLYSALMEDLGVHTIASFQNGFSGIAMNGLPEHPEDPDFPKTDFKVRVWAAKAPERTMLRLGYLVTTLPWADCFSAMQTGVIDGVYGGDILDAYDAYRDVMTHWLDYRGFHYASYYTMNLELWNSLSPTDQQIFIDACRSEEELRITTVLSLEEETENKLRDYGIEIVKFSDAELAHIAEIVRRDVWPELEQMMGKKLMDEIYAAIEAF